MDASGTHPSNTTKSPHIINYTRIHTKQIQHSYVHLHRLKDQNTGNTICAYTIPKLQFDNKIRLSNDILIYTTELIAMQLAIYVCRKANIKQPIVTIYDSLSGLQSLHGEYSQASPAPIHTFCRNYTHTEHKTLISPSYISRAFYYYRKWTGRSHSKRCSHAFRRELSHSYRLNQSTITRQI